MAVLELLPWDMVVHRITSDPHPEELVAPLWMLDRQGVRKRLEKAMKEADFREGSAIKLYVSRQFRAMTGAKPLSI